MLINLGTTYFQDKYTCIPLWMDCDLTETGIEAAYIQIDGPVRGPYVIICLKDNFLEALNVISNFPFITIKTVPEHELPNNGWALVCPPEKKLIYSLGA